MKNFQYLVTHTFKVYKNIQKYIKIKNDNENDNLQ